MAAALVAPQSAIPAFRPHPSGRPLRPTGAGRPARTTTLGELPAPRLVDASVYRRRRVVVLLLVLEVVLAGALIAGGVVSAFTGPPALAPVATAAAPNSGAPVVAPDVVVVRPGDTLWSIARELDPDGDPRPLVDELVQRTGGAGLRPGQRVRVDGLR